MSLVGLMYLWVYATSRLDDAKNVATFIAVIVGIASGTYALYQSWRKAQATTKVEAAAIEAKAEAQRLADRSAAITALEATVQAQGKVIEGLTKGLEDCIERDNAKQEELNRLRTSDFQKGWEISQLKAKVAALEARNP
jgi:hypothetical protein